MFATSRKSCYSQSDVDYYRREAEDAEDRLRQERERQEQEREARRREREEAAEERVRTAHSWPDALQKQARLHGREVRYEDPIDPNEDFYFSETVKACNWALHVYNELENARQQEFDELYERIAAIKAEIREATAQAVEKENERSGWQQLAQALRQYDDNNVSDWLDW